MGILMASSLESFIELIGALLIFVFVLMVTWLVTRWMGGYQKSKRKNTNLDIVETMPVGNSKYISIVRTGNKYLAVSIGKDEIHLLTELEASDLELQEEKAKDDKFGSFAEVLKDKLSKK